MLSRTWGNRHLVGQLAKRDVMGRYRGSLLGLFWSFLHPLFMLLVYVFVFGVVFELKWGVTPDAGEKAFSVILFSGLILHRLLSECLVRAPGIIVSNAQFVKKVVFPLEVFPIVVVATSLFHFIVGFLLLLVFNSVAHSAVYPTVLLAPVVILPIVLLGLGLSWFLAATGVFIRDIGQLTGILTTVLLFLCPIFYPLDRVPEEVQWLLYFNPLTLIVESFRDIVIFGRLPSWEGLAIYYLVALLVLVGGYLWFQRTQPAFADVV
ncbi:MAG TPA: ABC transporter permease [Arenicellales bacterium]|nr:ABC transporter permease [Arenicellales bacterium]